MIIMPAAISIAIDKDIIDIQILINHFDLSAVTITFAVLIILVIALLLFHGFYLIARYKITGFNFS